MTRTQRIAGVLGTSRVATTCLVTIVLFGVLGDVGAAAGGGESSIAAGMSLADECDILICPTDHTVIAVAGGNGHGKSMLGLCLAVLVGMAVVLMVALAATREFDLYERSHPHRLIGPGPGAGPGPPGLYRLSLLRC
jgi:hypothetical protein